MTVTNSYDMLLRRSAVGLSNYAATLTTFGYDAASRLGSVTNGSQTVSYTYWVNSPLVQSLTFKQNGITRMTTSKSYDYLNRLTSISSAPSGTGILPVSFSYAYNNANQRTRRTESDSSYWSYEYDSLGQVKRGAKYFNDGYPVPGQQFNYAFDDIGNRKQTLSGGDQNGGNQRTSSYTANNLNQYTQRTVPGYADVIGVTWATNNVTVNGVSAWRKVEYFRAELTVANQSSPVWQNAQVNLNGQSATSGNLLVAPQTSAFIHDADGNQTGSGLWTNTWDAENRLISIASVSAVPTAGKQKLDCAYDYRSRRTQKIVSTNNGTAYVAQSTNRFIYDGWNLVAILDAANGLDRSFTWGTDLSGSMQGAGGVGGLISMTVNSGTNAGTYFFCYDGNGNVVALVNASNGTVAAQYEYGPFHEIIRATGPLAKVNPFLAATKFYDWETGLYYYGYRYYDPSTGRWWSRDPIEETGGVNLYGYCRNDSANRTDGLGLDELRWQKNECQGCDGGNPAMSTPNTCENNRAGKFVGGASGSFHSSCSKTTAPLCDTETHVYIRAKRGIFSCCKRWKVTCGFTYQAVVEGEDLARIYVWWRFLGRLQPNILEAKNAGGRAEWPPWSRTLTDETDISYWGWTVIAEMQARSISIGSANHTIDESGSIKCSAMCVRK